MFLLKKFRKIYLSVKTNCLPAEVLTKPPRKENAKIWYQLKDNNIESQHIFSRLSHRNIYKDKPPPWDSLVSLHACFILSV